MVKVTASPYSAAINANTAAGLHRVMSAPPSPGPASCITFCPEVLIATAFISRSGGTRSLMIDWREGIIIEFTPPCRTALIKRCQKARWSPNSPAASNASTAALRALYDCAS
jgi:hypothetical protein